MVASHVVVDGTTYDAATPPQVIRILEDARRRGTRLRLHYGDASTGRDWLEEFDVSGTIGRSMGPQKIPILLATRRSHGGGAILTGCIVKITATTAPRRVLYAHPNYHHGTLAARSCAVQSPRRILTIEVLVDEKPHARFPDDASLRRWTRHMNLPPLPREAIL